MESLSSRNCLHCVKQAIVPISQGVKSQKAVSILLSDRLAPFTVDSRSRIFSLKYQYGLKAKGRNIGRNGNAQCPFLDNRRGARKLIYLRSWRDDRGGIRATKTERSWTDFCSWPNPPQLPSRPGNTIELLLVLHSYLRAWNLVNHFVLGNWETSISFQFSC